MNERLRLVRAGLWVAAMLAAAAAAAQPQRPTTVRVSGYQVSGNTLLDPRALDAVLLPMLGQRSLEELNRAAAAVQALYAAEGYGAVVAYVPPQAAEGGVVTIAVVEGKIGQVVVKGQQHFTPENIRASLPALKEGTTPNVRILDGQLRIANENPAKQVQVLLKPGQRGGEADAEVTVTDRAAQRYSVTLDNTGNERTGEYRVAAGWQHGNLSGHDDIASLQLQTSPSDPGQVRVLSGAYRWPLYGARMVVDVFAAYSDIDGGTSQSLAGDLSFNGRGRIAGGRVAWYLPRRGDFDRRLALGVDRRDYLNRCEIAGLPPGACGPAGESVSVSPLSLEYLAQTTTPWPLSFALTLMRNLSLGGSHADAVHFDAVRPGAKPHYTALRWNAQAAWPVAEDWQLRARLTGQYTGDELVPGEQFGLGGASSVRGYEEREVVGDRGLFGSAELASPDLLGGEPSLRLHSFVDAGFAANQGEAPCVDTRARCSLASVGLGARYAAGNLQARLDLAYPMKAAARTQRGDTRAHFAVNYGF